MLDYPFNFRKIKGRFIERKNRFVFLAEIDGKVRGCYLPNPGRLWELLIPEETELMLTETPHNLRRLPFTVLAYRKEKRWILLHTHITNKIIKYLINHGKIPFYSGLKAVAEEVRVEGSRLDFLLEGNGQRILLEVKTCTLIGREISMFPDAVSERGRRHLIQLKELAEKGIKTSVLFAVMSPDVEFFLPAYHIDYEFSKTFLEIKDVVDIRAVSLRWDEDFSYVIDIRELKIPFSFIERILHERGVYILVIFLSQPELIRIGSGALVNFSAGYYIYVGSAKRGLFQRIRRHKRRNKKMHWHIDYLLDRAGKVKDFPIITDRHIECEVAERILRISDGIIPEFGSSDCKCPGHLFYFRENPLFKKEFIDIVTYLRLDFMEI